jgi:hypothetical protein
MIFISWKEDVQHTVDNGSSFNRIPVMAPILAPLLGFLFTGVYLPKKRT